MNIHCPTCHGKGRHSPNTLCPSCGGHGYNPETVTRLAKALFHAGAPMEDNKRPRRWAVAVLDALQEEPE